MSFAISRPQEALDALAEPAAAELAIILARYPMQTTDVEWLVKEVERKQLEVPVVVFSDLPPGLVSRPSTAAASLDRQPMQVWLETIRRLGARKRGPKKLSATVPEEKSVALV